MLIKECRSDSVTYYNYVGGTQKMYRLKKLHIKQDISYWNNKIILSVLIELGPGNPKLQYVCWVQQFQFRVRPIRIPRSILRKTTLRKRP